MKTQTLTPQLCEPYQRQLLATFGEFFRDECSMDGVRQASAASSPDLSLWDKLLSLGGLDVAVPEDAGGGGGSFLDAVLIGLQAGYSLAPIPYAESAAAHRFVARSGIPVRGPLRTGIALSAGIHRLTRHGTAWSGRFPFVSGGVGAELLIAPGSEGAILFLCETSTVQCHVIENLGGLPLARAELDSALPLWQSSSDAFAEQSFWHELRLLYAAQLTGAGRAALELAVEHVKVREQFGRPIGSFQALQHRLADRWTGLEASEALVIEAAARVSEDGVVPPDGERIDGRLALHYARREAELACAEALQMFGGYGFTLEYDIHLYLAYAKSYSVATSELSKRPIFWSVAEDGHE